MRDLPMVTIHIGEVHAAREPTVVQTVLGSCIAVCLFDPEARVGGMNHFMLPEQALDDPSANSARYGVHAMELLIGAIQKLGGRRHRLRAKVFGGGHVLRIAASEDGVPARNIAFIDAFLRDEELTVAARDVGGQQARRVLLETDTGRVLVKRLGRREQREVQVVERTGRERIQRVPLAAGAVELFDGPS